MAIASKSVEYMKELDDVMVLAIELIKDIKAKKTAAEILAGTLPRLMSAIEGMDKISGELENRQVAFQTVGYRSGELSAALIG